MLPLVSAVPLVAIVEALEVATSGGVEDALGLVVVVIVAVTVVVVVIVNAVDSRLKIIKIKS